MARKKYEETDGVWRTIRGRKVFIREGQTAAEAIAESKKNAEERPVAKKLAKQKRENKESIEKRKSNEQIEKDFPDNLSDEVKEHARILNTRGYDDVDDVIDDFAEEHGITRSEAKYALLKDEFKQRQETYMDAKTNGSYSDEELEDMEVMAKDSYFKLQETKEQIDSFNKENKTIQERYGLKDKRNEEYVHDYERGDIKQDELKDLLRRGGESEETIHGVVEANTGANSRDPKIRALFAEDEMKKTYMEIPEEERVKAYTEGKNWKDLVKERKTTDSEEYKAMMKYTGTGEDRDFKDYKQLDDGTIIARDGRGTYSVIEGSKFVVDGEKIPGNGKYMQTNSSMKEDLLELKEEDFKPVKTLRDQVNESINKEFNDYLNKRGVSQEQYKFLQEMQKDWLDAEGYKGEINDFDKQGYARNIIEEYTADKKAGKLNGKTLEQYGVEWTNWGEGHSTPMPDKYKNILKGNGEWKTEYKSGMDLNTRLRENQEKADKIIADDEWNDITTSYQGNKASIVNERTGRRVKIGPYDTNETLRKKIKESYEERPVAAKLSKTKKEYRIIDQNDNNKVIKTFGADEFSKGYDEMRAMGKELKAAGKEDALILKEYRVKNKPAVDRPVAEKLSKQAATRRYNRMPAERQKAVDDLMRKGGISRAEAISAADEFIKLVGETPGKSKEQMLEELMKRGYSRSTAEKMLRQRKRK